MAIVACEPVTAEGREPDEATAAAKAWLAKELRFERLLDQWRAVDGAPGSE